MMHFKSKEGRDIYIKKEHIDGFIETDECYLRTGDGWLALTGSAEQNMRVYNGDQPEYSEEKDGLLFRRF